MYSFTAYLLNFYSVTNCIFILCNLNFIIFLNLRYIQSMSKSFIVLAIVALTCVSALHLQTFAPSKPGGTYYGTNGTQSVPNTYYNTQPAPNTYYNTQPAPNTYYNYNTQPTNYNTQSSTTTDILVNGRPYNFTGPFRLVCYQQYSTNIFRQDTCTNASACATLLNEYRNCIGVVKRFPL